MRWVPFVALIGAAVPVHAAWERIEATGQQESGDSTLYVDRKSIEQLETTRRIRQLYDMRSATPSGMRSWISLEEYDCRGKQLRLLEAIAFAEPMAGGKQLGSMNIPLPWMRVTPGTSSERVLQIVCQ